MARKPRIEFPHAFYHVIVRGNQRRKVFWQKEDYEDYLSRLKLYRDKFDFAIYAYCLMPNHVHLLIETGDVPLSKIMQSLQFSYTQSFNRRNKKIGHLFQGRYKAIICDKDAYLLELIRYIHLNPARSRLVNKPQEYHWSSHREYIGEPVIIDATAIGLFGRSKTSAINAYTKFVQDGLKEGHREDYYRLKDQRVLGEDDFAEELIKKAEGWQGSYWNIEMSEIIEKTCEAFGADPLLLRSVRRGRKEALAKGVATILAKKLCGITLRKAGEFFNRTEQAMSNLLRRVEMKTVVDNAFAKKLATLEKKLIKDKRPLLVREIKQTRTARFSNTLIL